MSDDTAAGLMNSGEAAKYLGIGARTLWALTNTRRVAHVRIGRSVRYRREDLDVFVRDSTKRVARTAERGARR